MPTVAALLHDPRWRPAWAGLLLACALASAAFAFVPKPPADFGAGSDKLQHVLAFAAMALCGVLARAPTPRRHAEVMSGLLAYGLFIEAVQSRLPWRSAEVADLLADAIGIACGLLLAATLRRTLRRR